MRPQHWELEDDPSGADDEVSDKALQAASASSPHPAHQRAGPSHNQATVVDLGGQATIPLSSPQAARNASSSSMSRPMAARSADKGSWGLSTLLGLGSETPLSLTSVSPSDSDSRGGSTSEASSAAASGSVRSGGGRRSRRPRQADRSDSGSAGEDQLWRARPAVLSERDYVWNEFRRKPLGGAARRRHSDDIAGELEGRAHAEVDTPTVDEAGRSQPPPAFLACLRYDSTQDDSGLIAQVSLVHLGLGLPRLSNLQIAVATGRRQRFATLALRAVGRVPGARERTTC